MIKIINSPGDLTANSVKMEALDANEPTSASILTELAVRSPGELIIFII